MGNIPTGARDDDLDPGDEQSIAEAFDEENVEVDIDVDDWAPDHGLAVMEAMVVTDTGDVPRDSLDERTWREEPDRLEPSTKGWNEELLEPHPDFGLDADFAASSAAEFAHASSDGSTTGETGGPVEELLPAEEAAMHVVEGEEPADRL